MGTSLTHGWSCHPIHATYQAHGQCATPEALRLQHQSRRPIFGWSYHEIQRECATNRESKPRTPHSRFSIQFRLTIPDIVIATGSLILMGQVSMKVEVCAVVTYAVIRDSLWHTLPSLQEPPFGLHCTLSMTGLETSSVRCPHGLSVAACR